MHHHLPIRLLGRAIGVGILFLVVLAWLGYRYWARWREAQRKQAERNAPLGERNEFDKY